MADTIASFGRPTAAAGVHVKRIGLHDIADSLRAGYADFRANPTHLIFLGLIYPVMGLVLGRLESGDQALPLVYPLISGFALVGPFASVGLYEFSRRREHGLPVTMRDAFSILRSTRIVAILGLGMLLGLWFFAWLRVALGLYEATIPGSGGGSIGSFLGTVLGTQAGWTLIVVGTAVGFLFAVVVLVFGVVSFPMLVDTDRDLGAGADRQMLTALTTSARAAMENKPAIAVWGLVVAASLLAGTVTLLVGFAVTMPILGHATWHLYRKMVA